MAISWSRPTMRLGLYQESSTAVATCFRLESLALPKHADTTAEALGQCAGQRLPTELRLLAACPLSGRAALSGTKRPAVRHTVDAPVDEFQPKVLAPRG